MKLDMMMQKTTAKNDSKHDDVDLRTHVTNVIIPE